MGENINIIKTTFDFNFDLYQAFEQHGYTKKVETKRSCQKSFFLITCKLVIRKKLATN